MPDDNLYLTALVARMGRQILSLAISTMLLAVAFIVHIISHMI